MKKLILCILFLSVSTGLYANTNNYVSSIQIKPLSVFSARLALNYEVLVFQQHGIVLDADFNVLDIPYSSYAVQYRYHLNPYMDSFFVGVFCRYSNYKGVSLSFIYNNDGLSGSSSEYSGTVVTLGLMAGYKLVFGNGIGLCFRFGAGYPFYIKQPSSPSIDVNKVTFNIFTAIADIMDSEISVGYSF